MAHRVLSHTADTGVEATAATFAALLEELLEAMFGLMADIGRLEADTWTEATVSSDTAPDLVVDVLSEALYWSDVDDVLPCRFEARVGPDRCSALVRLGGQAMSGVESIGPAIKAVTYHGLVVEERPQGWYGRVYLDV